MTSQERIDAAFRQVVGSCKAEIKELLAGQNLPETMLSLGVLDAGHAHETDRMLQNLNLAGSVNYRCRIEQEHGTTSCMFVAALGRKTVLRYLKAAELWTRRSAQRPEVPDGSIGAFVFDACDGIRNIDFDLRVLDLRALDEAAA